jgi:hypothetical protein
MIKNWKMLSKDDINHLSEANIRYEYDWQVNLRQQKYWLITYGLDRTCRQCVTIAQKLGQWRSLTIPDDVRGCKS